MDRRERMNDPLIAMRAALDGLQTTIWTALPGIVQSFDPVECTVSVQTTIKEPEAQSDGSVKLATLPLLIHCPVVMPGSAGFMLTLPLAKGDEGLVVFASRPIDSWWQQGGVQSPVENRMHDLSDGFFIPGCYSKPHVPGGISTTKAQLRSFDGLTYVELTPGGIVNIKAHGGLNVDAENTGVLLDCGSGPLNVIAGTITVTGSGALNISAPGGIAINGGAPLRRLLVGSLVWAGATLPAFTPVVLPFAVAGAKVGDGVTIGMSPGAPSSAGVITAVVSAANVVSIRIYNANPAAVPYTPTTFTVFVIGTSP